MTDSSQQLAGSQVDFQEEASQAVDFQEEVSRVVDSQAEEVSQEGAFRAAVFQEEASRAAVFLVGVTNTVHHQAHHLLTHRNKVFPLLRSTLVPLEDADSASRIFG